MAEFLPLIGFVFFGLFSPGPNVILLTASGARFGIQRTMPHISGVAIGVGITSAVTGFGVGAVLNSYPALKVALQIGACLWILWMAYKLWFASPNRSDGNDRPFTFFEAVLFQWVNPKVWAVALSATAFLPEMPMAQQAGTLAVTFSTINLCVCIFWTCTGTVLAYLLQNHRSWRIFMRIMALALVVFSALIFV